MGRPVFSFRQAQAAFDLIDMLRRAEPEALARLGATEVVHARAARFEAGLDSDAYEAVGVEALDGGPDAALAVALLLANELQFGHWRGEPGAFVETAQARIEAAPKLLCAAIARAVDAAQDVANPWEKPADLLPGISRLTREMDDILPALCRIAKSMSPQTRANVSHADYGMDPDKHLAALNDVLSRDTCRMTKDETWHPSEVVELVAHVRDTEGFVPCTALLLANALPTLDELGWFDFRWMNLSRDYVALPDSARGPILSGLRYLYEADREWMFYCEKSPDPVEAPELMLPVPESLT